jgi:hypothetical protein
MVLQHLHVAAAKTAPSTALRFLREHDTVVHPQRTWQLAGKLKRRLVQLCRGQEALRRLMLSAEGPTSTPGCTNTALILTVTTAASSQRQVAPARISATRCPRP